MPKKQQKPKTKTLQPPNEYLLETEFKSEHEIFFKYAIAETILCEWGTKQYFLSKVKYRRLRKSASGEFDDPEYYITYNGFSAKYDEWVGDNQCMENDGKVKATQKKYDRMVRCKSKKRSAVVEEEENTDGSRTESQYEKKKQRKNPREPTNNSTKRQKQVPAHPAYVSLPRQFKTYLFEQQDFILQKHMLIPLPRDPSFTQIYQNYIKSRTRPPSKEKEMREKFECLADIFDRVLPIMLLYTFEKPFHDSQMNTHLHTRCTASELYGIDHWLRFIVALPDLWDNELLGDMNSTELRDICDLLEDFVLYLKTALSGALLHYPEGYWKASGTHVSEAVRFAKESGMPVNFKHETEPTSDETETESNEAEPKSNETETDSSTSKEKSDETEPNIIEEKSNKIETKSNETQTESSTTGTKMKETETVPNDIESKLSENTTDDNDGSSVENSIHNKDNQEFIDIINENVIKCDNGNSDLSKSTNSRIPNKRSGRVLRERSKRTSCR